MMEYERASRRVVVHEVEPLRLLVSTTRHPDHRFWMTRIPSTESGAVVVGCHADVSGRWSRYERGTPQTLVECTELRVCMEGTPEEIMAVFKVWFDAQGFDREEIARKCGDR